ncbi:hypothetical protein BO70DRAFT_410089 [Aspergillus heteromorphus CBS 117.55]|uniref:Uncharacterized protein n=1 Tax=Aspergillus heteromorphus CBS 117.55 TaxID=1448321 RepID=A0A317WWE8_9EURO|nr:uncharacterized protein BO70DRAFT_410089 [Aspergillus heteromorphus CBS 117.55]PWY90716.1 hypothetical protein BO70DRAFT_410089 [Aspergillus heteromorphus CBS 117.55]
MPFWSRQPKEKRSFESEYPYRLKKARDDTRGCWKGTDVETWRTRVQREETQGVAILQRQHRLQLEYEAAKKQQQISHASFGLGSTEVWLDDTPPPYSVNPNIIETQLATLRGEYWKHQHHGRLRGLRAGEDVLTRGDVAVDLVDAAKGFFIGIIGRGRD